LKKILSRFRAWQKDPQKNHVSADLSVEHTCANCGHVFRGNCCPVCRQDAGDGHITWRWLYKCILTVWGMDSRSLPHTLLQLLFRPGYLIGDYLSGRRQVSYTPFNMLFIVALFYAILRQLLGYTPTESSPAGDQFPLLMDAVTWLQQNPAWAMLFMTTLLILPTWCFFRFAPRHPHHTLPEGIFIQLFMGTLMLLILLLTRAISGFFTLLIPFYYVVAYRQLFGYSVWGTLWRLLLSFLVWLNVSFLLIFAVASFNNQELQEYSAAHIFGYLSIILIILLIIAAILLLGYFISKKGAKVTSDE